MNRKKNINSYAKYSTIAIQMGAIIAGGTYAGIKLDEHFNYENVFTVILSLCSVMLAMFLAIKDVIKYTNNKEN